MGCEPNKHQKEKRNMSMNVIRKIGYTGIAALLLTGSVIAAAPPRQSSAINTKAPAWNFQKEASDALKEVQVLSGKLRLDTEKLESFPRSKLSWESHANQLNLVRDHINQIGERLERLQEIRHVTSPWQRQAIDRIVPGAAELASRTQAAIMHLNENRGYLFAPTYADHLSTIAEQADEMKTTVDTFLEYADTEQKLQRLQERLEVGQS
jgi:hypothetical protein